MQWARTMLVAALGALAVLAAGCATEGAAAAEDQAACDAYEDLVERVNAGEVRDDDHMADELEEVWQLAETDRLQDAVDDLLMIYDGDRDRDELDGIVRTIRGACGQM